MMINKRLIETVSESKRYIAGNVLMQWISLLGNLVMMTTIANLLEGLYQGNACLLYTSPSPRDCS